MRVSQKAAIAIAVALVVAIPAIPAFAYWHSSGTGTAAASTATLVAPTSVTPVTNGASVSISWTASGGALTPTGYLVTRSSGGMVSAACGSSIYQPVTTTSCIDTVANDGSYTYTVTALFHSWSAQSRPSAAVAVAVPAKLAFSVAPSSSAPNAVISPDVAVVVRSADGNPVLTSGIGVALAIAANPAAGTLAGTLNRTTDGNGVATFPGLSIDAVGAGYTLRATSGSLASSTSTTFDIAAAGLAGPALGRAAPFSVLGSAVTIGAGTTIGGDLGATSAVTTVQNATVQGETHVGDSTASGAASDLSNAYADAAGRAADDNFAGDQAGKTFLPGVHRTGAAFTLSAGGVVTLDAQNNPNAVFIFQINGALNTAASSVVKLVNGAQAANVYWQSSGAAGTGANSIFVGTLLTSGAITIGDGGQLMGRALGDAAVTLSRNAIWFTTISITGGASVTTASHTPTVAGTTSAPAGRRVTVTFNGQTLNTVVAADGGWTVMASSVPSGSYTALVRILDSSRNGATATQTVGVQ